ncbi:hypothetical protein [Bacillus cereus]|uniref:hypothetical protein n=1 Tax=Bacillus cereus TaxID=1396 RepID=UPI00350E4F86
MKEQEVLLNESESIKEAHDASKASIQSRISNLESGGVKGTGEVNRLIPGKVTGGSSTKLGKNILQNELLMKHNILFLRNLGGILYYKK